MVSKCYSSNIILNILSYYSAADIVCSVILIVIIRIVYSFYIFVFDIFLLIIISNY